MPGGYLNYWPLTYTAYWLQFHLWGLHQLGFHLVNLALHALAALLVWRVLVRLKVPGALFAAAIFALHPVNVETAAWIAHLKDILSLVLALVSMLFYLDSERYASRWRYGLAIATFLLSTLAKGTAVTLPIVLLACAWWQRGRIGWRDLLRVLPYFLIGAVMSGIEVWTQQSVGHGDVVRTDGFFSRLAVAGCALWFYLGKVILPLNLCPIYPRWAIDEQSVLAYLPGVMWLIVLGVAWWKRRTWGRPVVMLMICYAALLLPILGFVNIYFMRYSLVSDHWQYIATIVPCAVFAGVTTTAARRLLIRPAAIAVAISLAGVLGVLTFFQSRTYADAETFYQTVLGPKSRLLVGPSQPRHRFCRRTVSSPPPSINISRRSISIPTTPRPTTTSAMCCSLGRKWMGPWSISARRWRSSRTIPRRSTIWGLYWLPKAISI